MASASNRKPLLILIVGASVLALSGILVRLTHTGPAAAGFWRLTCAMPLLALLALREGPAASPAARMTTRAHLKIIVIAGLMFAADMVCWHYSLHMTSVANATVLGNLTPVLLTLVGWLFFKERPTVLFLCGLSLALAGAASMAMSAGGGGRGTNPDLGNVLAVITTVWYGGYFLAVRQARKSMSAIKIMLGSSLVGAPVMLVVALAFHEPVLPTAAIGWAACIGLGLVHVAGQGSIAWALGKLPAPLTAVVVLVQPATAAILSWFIFHEAIGPLQAVGGLMALAGVALAQAAPQRTPAPVAGEAEAMAKGKPVAAA
ncbi:DMT family transporter [Caulobacter sp. S45]|uniref:DMT family transporter n=1 Tax=Caulobacter sp. S45 TaxID=1641861 RepID=UPI00131DB1D3|nr:DMT family transporter [Caulobacter sp. S45]